MQNVSNNDLISTKVIDLKGDDWYGRMLCTEQSSSSVADDKIKAIKTGISFEVIKKQNNREIIDSSLQVSVGVGNEPIALLLKTVIDGINKVRTTKRLSENFIQETYDSGLDLSPVATVNSIVSMGTAFFSQFQKQHTALSVKDAAKSFSEIFGGGVDKGFEEVREIILEKSVGHGCVENLGVADKCSFNICIQHILVF